MDIAAAAHPHRAQRIIVSLAPCKAARRRTKDWLHSTALTSEQFEMDID